MKKKKNRYSIFLLTILAAAVILIGGILAIVLFRLPDPKIDKNPPPLQIDPAGTLNIAMRRELFWDDYLIDTEKTTATHMLHEPVKQELVLQTNEAWEGGGSDCFNIINDNGLYRLYYLAYEMPTSDNIQDYRPEVRLCHAESTDGLNWEKTHLNTVEYNGNKNNNIVMRNKKDVFYSFFVFIDSNPETPDNEKYKALAISEKDKRLMAYTSENGISWKKSRALSSKISTQNNYASSLNTAFWDEQRQRYYCYFTQTEENGNSEIYVTTSVDFKAWTLPQSLDYQSGAEHFNLLTANIAPYYRAPHIYMGTPLRLSTKNSWNSSFNSLAGSDKRRSIMQIDEAYALGLTDTLFMTSRNGLNWNIIEEAWVTPGAEHSSNWLYADTYTAHGMIETPALHSADGEDNELSLYISEDKWGGTGAKLYRYSTRIDGFASYSSTYNTQKVVTKPLQFEGSRMLLNFSTSPNGYVFVRILDENGNPFPAVEYEGINAESYSVPMYTSHKLFGDRVEREVAFNGELAQLNGQTVVIEFIMSDANIYSFKFDDEPYENTESWVPSEIPLRNFTDAQPASNGDAINIGTQRELFWDDYIVDKSKTDAALVMHSPQRKEELFKTDKPWEGNQCDYYNITIDEDENGFPLYRMYYLGWDSSNTEEIRVCYAYSHDGIEWIKPDLDIYSYYDEATGTTYEKTNIILLDEEPIFDNFFVMKDTREGISESERYKGIAQGNTDTGGNPDFGLWAWLSEDGIHWRKSHKILPQIGDEDFDSVNTLIWDEYTQQYFLFFRTKNDSTVDGDFHYLYRGQMGCTSTDFFNWNPDDVFHLDYGENSLTFEMYTNNIDKYYRADHIFVGFPTRFNRVSAWAKNYEYLAGSEARRQKYNDGKITATLSMTETLFMTSRDGQNWNRRNTSWLTPGPEHEANWIYGNCYPSYKIIETAAKNEGEDNELSTYVFEGKFYPDRPSVMYRYAMRIDGMAGYKATYKEQSVYTRPFTFEGSQLLLNFKTSAAGSICIRLLDENGTLIEGYESEEIFGNRVDRPVYFDKDVAELSGKTIIMEFIMSDAEIFSFKFD